MAAAGFTESLGMSSTEVGLNGTIYLIGAVVGALTFGRITDRWGRRKPFTKTLAIHLIGIAGRGVVSQAGPRLG